MLNIGTDPTGNQSFVVLPALARHAHTAGSRIADNGIVVSTRRHGGRQKRRPAGGAGAYVLMARDADGRTRCESFGDRRAYRSRLATLGSADGPVTLEEVVDLLTDVQPRDPR